MPYEPALIALARYARQSAGIDTDLCILEKEAGRCPYDGSGPTDEAVCVRCIIRNAATLGACVTLWDGDW